MAGSAVLIFLLAAMGIAAAVLAAYLLVLAVAGCFLPTTSETGPARHRLLVVIPAHNEAAMIGRCVDSLRKQSYPQTRYELLVVADNCTDRTAAVAQASGVQTLVREDSHRRGKGFALRWTFDRILSEPDPADAFVIVDADSVADENLLSALEAEFARGADAVQGDVSAMVAAGCPESYLAATALLLFHRVRMAGRQRLGFGASLCGNGMLLSRRLLMTHPWKAFSCAEDLEYWLDLRLAGVRPGFARAARIEAAGPADAAEMDRQHRRWEGGRFAIAAAGIAVLLSTALRRQSLELLDAAAELAVPPLGLLALTDLVGLAISGVLFELHVVSAAVPELWLGAAVVLLAFVVAGLAIAEAPAWAYLALLQVPGYLARKARIYYEVARRFDAAQWEPQPSASGNGESPVYIGRVPINPIGMAAAVGRLKEALASPSLVHVCTVNAHFLAQARRREEVRRLAQRSDLNLADGWPVVWLGRLRGRAVPERVAGADLVPNLITMCAENAAPVFLLGGVDGTAHEAAQRLVAQHPALVIAGVLEPPLSSVDRMDNQAIVETINSSGAAALLVAFGNPKQELWIDMHRNQLNVSLAIGVGSCIDLLAGRRCRAPIWMQAAGLEWLYRVWCEPRRLAGRYATDAAGLALITLSVLVERLHVALRIPQMRNVGFTSIEQRHA